MNHHSVKLNLIELLELLDILLFTLWSPNPSILPRGGRGDRSDRSYPDQECARIWDAGQARAAKNCAATSFAAAEGCAAAERAVAMSRVAELLDAEPPDR